MNRTDAATIPKPHSWDVEPNPATIRPARRLIRHLAASWRVPLTDDALWDAELCAGELLANAIEYGQECCRITVLWTGARLRVEIADRSPQPPVRSKADDMATNGRGLLLVEALAHSWGWHPVEKGKVVWFEAAPDRAVTGVDPASGRGATVSSPSSRYEIRPIDSCSPHFLLLECWGIYDRERHEYLRALGDPHRIRRFYTLASAEAYLRYPGA
ncbi:ATP-binding protein [Kitasatospora sp. NPDC091276]|uniref:ATP-binding protein n=1 Tax=unclassified Kitasatospora TaxID=2633591 RepID=UPI00342B81AC